ncbi:MAG: hypothetical protein HY020_02555 [Burkholderiales bacterium]|nr:hypothetical protein [Burkholderiales bacterium]
MHLFKPAILVAARRLRVRPLMATNWQMVAARLSDSVFLCVSSKGAQACCVLHTGAKDGCERAGVQAVCRTPGSGAIKGEWLPVGQRVRIRSNAEALQIQHRQGLMTQTGSIHLSLDNGTTLRAKRRRRQRVRGDLEGLAPVQLAHGGHDLAHECIADADVDAGAQRHEGETTAAAAGAGGTVHRVTSVRR